MNEIARINVGGLPAMVDRAAKALASAASAAEVLDAKRVADDGYDVAKKAARIAKAVDAHDEVVAKAHRAQADCLEISAAAARRLADEYDAAQERGEVGQSGVRTDLVPEENEVRPATAEDIGLTRKQVHEARIIRDAEQADPGIVRRVLDDRLAKGEEPTKAALREAVIEAARIGKGAPAPTSRNHLYTPPTPAGEAWTKLYGACRALTEWGTPENISLAEAGKAERRDDQAANIAAIQKAADLLNTFLGAINAE